MMFPCTGGTPWTTPSWSVWGGLMQNSEKLPSPTLLPACRISQGSKEQTEPVRVAVVGCLYVLAKVTHPAQRLKGGNVIPASLRQRNNVIDRQWAIRATTQADVTKQVTHGVPFSDGIGTTIPHFERTPCMGIHTPPVEVQSAIALLRSTPVFTGTFTTCLAALKKMRSDLGVAATFGSIVLVQMSSTPGALPLVDAACIRNIRHMLALFATRLKAASGATIGRKLVGRFPFVACATPSPEGLYRLGFCLFCQLTAPLTVLADLTNAASGLPIGRRGVEIPKRLPITARRADLAIKEGRGILECILTHVELQSSLTMPRRLNTRVAFPMLIIAHQDAIFND